MNLTVSVRVMRGQHQNTLLSTRDNSTNMDPIEAAIADIESLGPGESFSYTKFATKYSVVRSTLIRRHRGVTRP